MKLNTMLATPVLAALIGATTLLGANVVMAEKRDGMGDDRERVCEHRKNHGHQSKHDRSWKKQGHHRGGFDGPMSRNLDLDAKDVRTLVSAKLIMRGNDRLKVGNVVAGSDDTYRVDIVTVDDSLVRTLTMSGKTGRPVHPRADKAMSIDESEG